jgi:hypothetical protein
VDEYWAAFAQGIKLPGETSAQMKARVSELEPEPGE